MPVVLSPALGVIYIQYAKNALPRPYRDFERFEIYTTLLEELNPLDSYERHRPRIAADPRSEVVAYESMRRELYNKWAASARTARQRGNQDWNNFIAFVNAQLKHYVDLNYEQFRFLCDAMAGFRLCNLSPYQKRSLFYGCVLRREWRFAHIRQIINHRECLQDFIGPFKAPIDGTAVYIAQISKGLELPSIPLSFEQAEQMRQEDKELQAAYIASLRDDPLSPDVAVTSAEYDDGVYGEEYESLFAHAVDVLLIVAGLQQIERGADDHTEEEISDSIRQLGTLISHRSDAMHEFGILLEQRVEKSASHDFSMTIYASLKYLAMTAQGRSDSGLSRGADFGSVTGSPAEPYCPQSGVSNGSDLSIGEKRLDRRVKRLAGATSEGAGETDRTATLATDLSENESSLRRTSVVASIGMDNEVAVRGKTHSRGDSIDLSLVEAALEPGQQTDEQGITSAHTESATVNTNDAAIGDAVTDTLIYFRPTLYGPAGLEYADRRLETCDPAYHEPYESSPDQSFQHIWPLTDSSSCGEHSTGEATPV